jgi:hypothetical protein
LNHIIYIYITQNNWYLNCLWLAMWRVKNTFEPNVVKWVIKIIFINSSPFSLLIINVNILYNFQKEWCTFGRKKKMFEKKQGLFTFEVWMFWTWKNILNLCQALNFTISGLYSKNNYDNLNYYAFLVIFQTYKNAI